MARATRLVSTGGGSVDSLAAAALGSARCAGVHGEAEGGVVVGRGALDAPGCSVDCRHREQSEEGKGELHGWRVGFGLIDQGVLKV